MMEEERQDEAVSIPPELARQFDAYLQGRQTGGRFAEAKSLIDDVLGRITWRGFFMLLMGIELVTDGPNGSVERMLEAALSAFTRGG